MHNLVANAMLRVFLHPHKITVETILINKQPVKLRAKSKTGKYLRNFQYKYVIILT